MGPKVWFRLNNVPVAWRPLPAAGSAPPVPAAGTRVDRLALLALIGSGLAMSELLRLRVENVGSLDGEAGLIPDPEAEPLAVRHAPRRGGSVERITFLTYHARLALLEDLATPGTMAGRRPGATWGWLEGGPPRSSRRATT